MEKFVCGVVGLITGGVAECCTHISGMLPGLGFTLGLIGGFIVSDLIIAKIYSM